MTETTEKIEISSSDEKKSSSLKESYFYEYIRKVINEDHFILKPVRIFVDLEDLNDMNYFLLIAVHLILVIFTLYRLWGKTCFNTLYKIIISILSLFPMVVILVLIITYMIDGCDNVSNLVHNIKNTNSIKNINRNGMGTYYINNKNVYPESKSPNLVKKLSKINDSPNMKNSLRINSSPNNSLKINSSPKNSLRINSSPNNSLKINSSPNMKNSLRINSSPNLKNVPNQTKNNLSKLI
jgi:hypothetical protein